MNLDTTETFLSCLTFRTVTGPIKMPLSHSPLPGAVLKPCHSHQTALAAFSVSPCVENVTVIIPPSFMHLPDDFTELKLWKIC